MCARPSLAHSLVLVRSISQTAGHGPLRCLAFTPDGRYLHDPSSPPHVSPKPPIRVPITSSHPSNDAAKRRPPPPPPSRHSRWRAALGVRARRHFALSACIDALIHQSYLWLGVPEIHYWQTYRCIARLGLASPTRSSLLTHADDSPPLTSGWAARRLVGGEDGKLLVVADPTAMLKALHPLVGQ